MSEFDLDRGQRAFRGAWWLPGAHLQTVWGQFTRARSLVPFERELLATPDGDELVLDHVAGPPGSPRLLILHGLEGSSYSVYVQGMAVLASAAGARVTVLNFRSCARDPRRGHALAAERSAASLSLGRDHGPRPRGAHAGRPRARGSAGRGRRLARRQRAAQVARREPGPDAGPRRRDHLGAVRPRRRRAPPDVAPRRALRASLPADLARQVRAAGAALSRGRGADRPRARAARAYVPRVRRRRDRAAARLRRRHRLLRALELARLRRAHRHADPVHQRRGRPVPAARGAAPGRRARARAVWSCRSPGAAATSASSPARTRAGREYWAEQRAVDLAARLRQANDRTTADARRSRA